MFSEFLGESNGKTMLSEILSDCTNEQARAAVTTYCCLFKVNVDTKEWDDLMHWIWDCYNSWFDEFDDMEMFMCAYLV